MKINKINNLFFQKKLVAKANVIKKNTPERVNIYELEKEVDKDYFEKISKDENWKNAQFLEFIESDFKYLSKGEETIYSMEDSSGNVLGLSKISDFMNLKILELIETAPKYSIIKRGRRTFKYIGETMLAFIASLCKKEDKYLDIADVVHNRKVRKFYFNNCGFEDLTCDRAILRKNKIDNFLEHNKAHTSLNIELI